MIQISVKNMDKLTKGLERFPNLLREAISRTIRASAFYVEAEAKPVTPVDTGRLRASIGADKIEPFEAIISPHTDYAIFVHEGTRYMRKRPFMLWGSKKARPLIQQTFADEIARAAKNTF